MSEPKDPIAIRGYRDFKFLGRGASSVVYEAFQEEFDRRVAVKILLADDPEDPARKRFAREKAIVGRLGGHPHIVQVFESSVTVDGRPYIAMQLYDGSLADRIETGGSLSVSEAVSIMADIAGATQAAHDAGVLHRDIKPQNILLSSYGPGLADFGIARAAANLNWSQTLRNLTPLHAAPENFLDERQPDARSDIWSLGSTLFTALAGRPPFFLSSSEQISKYQLRLEREPVPHIPRNDVSPALTEVINRALAKNPDERFATAAAMEQALRSLLDSQPSLTSPLVPLVVTETTLARRPGPPLGEPTAITPGSTSESGGAGSMVGGQFVAGVNESFDPAVGDAATLLRGSPRPDISKSGPDTGSRHVPWMLIAGAVVALLVVFALGAVVLGHGGGGGGGVTVPPHVPTVPTDPSHAPTSFTAVDLGSSVDLSWVDNSGGAASYIVEYRSVTGPLMSQQPQAPNVMTIRGLDPKLGYCFRLIAVGKDKSGHRTESALDTSVRGCVPTATPPVT